MLVDSRIRDPFYVSLESEEDVHFIWVKEPKLSIKMDAIQLMDWVVHLSPQNYGKVESCVVYYTGVDSEGEKRVLKAEDCIVLEN